MEKGKTNNPNGRPKGSPNKKTEELQDLADRLGCNPFEVLLKFAMNDWKGLGYDTETRELMGPRGPVEIMHVSPETRMKAAAEAAQYLFPKRKAIEHTGKDGDPLFTTFTDLVKSVSNLPKTDGNGS